MKTKIYITWNVLLVSLGCFLFMIHSSRGMFGGEYDQTKAHEAADLKAQQQAEQQQRARAATDIDNQVGNFQNELGVLAPAKLRNGTDSTEKTQLLQAQLSRVRTELTTHEATRDRLQREFQEHEQTIRTEQKKVDDLKIQFPIRSRAPGTDEHSKLQSLRNTRDAAIVAKNKFVHETSSTLNAAKNSIATLLSSIQSLEQQLAQHAASIGSSLHQQTVKTAAPPAPLKAPAVVVSPADPSPVFDLLPRTGASFNNSTFVASSTAGSRIPTQPATTTPARSEVIPTDDRRGTQQVNAFTGPEANIKFDIRAHSAIAQNALTKALAQQANKYSELQKTTKTFEATPVYHVNTRATLDKASLTAKIKFNLSQTDTHFQQVRLDYLDALSRSHLSPEEQHEKYATFEQAVKQASALNYHTYSLEVDFHYATSKTQSNLSGELESRKTAAAAAEKEIQKLLADIQKPHTNFRNDRASTSEYQETQLKTSSETASSLHSSPFVLNSTAISSAPSKIDIYSLQTFAERHRASLLARSPELLPDDITQLEHLNKLLELLTDSTSPSANLESLNPLIDLMKEIESKKQTFFSISEENFDLIEEIETEITTLEKKFMSQLSKLS